MVKVILLLFAVLAVFGVESAPRSYDQYFRDEERGTKFNCHSFHCFVSKSTMAWLFLLIWHSKEPCCRKAAFKSRFSVSLFHALQAVGVSNGPCEYLRACEHYEHKQ